MKKIAKAIFNHNYSSFIINYSFIVSGTSTTLYILYSRVSKIDERKMIMSLGYTGMCKEDLKDDEIVIKRYDDTSIDYLKICRKDIYI